MRGGEFTGAADVEGGGGAGGDGELRDGGAVDGAVIEGGGLGELEDAGVDGGGAGVGVGAGEGEGAGAGFYHRAVARNAAGEAGGGGLVDEGGLARA